MTVLALGLQAAAASASASLAARAKAVAGCVRSWADVDTGQQSSIAAQRQQR